MTRIGNLPNPRNFETGSFLFVFSRPPVQKQSDENLILKQQVAELEEELKNKGLPVRRIEQGSDLFSLHTDTRRGTCRIRNSRNADGIDRMDLP